MVNKLSIYILSFTLFTLGPLKAQKSELVVTKMSSQINSEAEELYPLFNIKTKTLYFSRAFHPNNEGGQYAGTDIWAIDLTDTSNRPFKQPFKNINDRNNNFVIGINAEEDILYVNESQAAEKGFNFVKKITDKWTKPERVAIQGLPIEGYRGIYVSPDNEVIILSMVESDTGSEDLYYSIKDAKGRWQQPQSLGTSINTKGREISPFLSSDKKFLYFASNGHPGQGDMDIFVAERLYDNWKVWSKPVNLGNKINSPAFDAYYAAYDTMAFFSSNRDGGLSEIYQVGIYEKDIKKLKEGTVIINSNDYNIYSENAINELFGVPMKQKLSFKAGGEELEPSSIEYIYFIIENMKMNPEIGIIIISDPKLSELNSVRMIRTSMLFMKSGITPKRFTLIEEDIENGKENEFLFYFYKLEK